MGYGIVTWERKLLMAFCLDSAAKLGCTEVSLLSRQILITTRD